MCTRRLLASLVLVAVHCEASEVQAASGASSETLQPSASEPHPRWVPLADQWQLANSLQKVANADGGGHLEEEEVPTGLILASFTEPQDKRQWSNFGGSWGKRAKWSNLGGAWGKRAQWNGMGGSWGKRAKWSGLGGAWGKRAAWNGIGGSWGKRAQWNGMNGAWGKRAKWSNLAGAWGKRAKWTDLGDSWGKRKNWDNFNGAWGKRKGWDSFSGGWGKRSAGLDLTKAASDYWDEPATLSSDLHQ